ncbi:MAG: hypothetical protein P9L91_03575, partial [Candidatus Zophobacter franzmannii]|nr:hypothetical protein [Candidatus Zophobacter franzmannii]
MKKITIIILLVLLSLCLSAEDYTAQSFENDTNDTWNYTANPAGGSRMVWWGRTDQPMGEANAQSGSWYWGSWDLDNNESTLTFDTISLPIGFIYTLNFYYYSNGLNPDTDFTRYSIAYDNGTEWDDWVTLSPDTDEWTLVSIAIPSYASQIRLRTSAQFDGFSKYAHWDNFLISRSDTEPTAPLVYNPAITQQTDGSGLVDIFYDIFDANGDDSTISLLLSADGGNSFDEVISTANLSGDIGDNITNGTGKHIVWDAG